MQIMVAKMNITTLARSLEKGGVSAMIIEDKVGSKNSLFKDQSGAKQDSPHAFQKR